MKHGWFEALADGGERRAGLVRRNPVREGLLAVRAGGAITLAVYLLYLVQDRLQGAGLPQLFIIVPALVLALPLVNFAAPDLVNALGPTLGAGLASRRLSYTEALRILAVTAAGNLAGMAACALLIRHSGLLADGRMGGTLGAAAVTRVGLSLAALVTRGILCQWVVALSAWMVRRTGGTGGRFVWSFWGVYAFLSAGLELAPAHLALRWLAGGGVGALVPAGVVAR